VVDIRVVVADDEPLARHGVVGMLASQPGIAVVGEARNGSEAVRAIRDHRPDLVFLDVQMPELDGFAVVRQLAAPLPLIVFITAFDDYAVRAFELAAIDYLVKPFTDRRFADMLARARHRLQQSEAAEVAQRLAALLAQPPASSTPTPAGPPTRDASLIATVGRRSVVVPFADIDWVEAQDYCVLVHTATGASHLVRESIRMLAERLASHHFLRVHRSALVNLARVRELRRPAHGEWLLILHDGTELPVSRRQRPAVTRLFANS
jgi:two-component system LytT family response regulator